MDLDSLRWFFGQPTMLDQMRTEAAKRAALTAPAPAQGLLPLPAPATPAPTAGGFGAVPGNAQHWQTLNAMQQRKDTLDAAMQELNRQNGVR